MTLEIKKAARAMCKRRNTHQCAAICLSHSSSFECPEQLTVWREDATAALKTLAEPSEAQVEAARRAIADGRDCAASCLGGFCDCANDARAALRAAIAVALGSP